MLVCTAIDVAWLLPPAVAARARALSRALPAGESKGLVLDDVRLPHITLTQQFVAEADRPRVMDAIDAVARGAGPVDVTVTGGGRGSSSVWMTVARTAALERWHARLMQALAPFERPAGMVVGGPAAAFVNGDARPGDVQWVAGFRTRSSFRAFTPHVTLGHARRPPRIAPFTFEARTLAVCQLGRFCTCQRVLRAWTFD